MDERTVEVLVLGECRNTSAALDHVRHALATTNVAADVRLVRIESEIDARRNRFLGSPTVRVEGIDVESTAAARDDYGMQCRLYSVAGHFESAPPVAWIVAALRSSTLQAANASSTADDLCPRGEGGDLCP